MPWRKGKPNGQHFKAYSPIVLSKDDSSKTYSIYMSHADNSSWFISYNQLDSIFLSVNFGYNVLFLHIFSVLLRLLHHNSIETSLFQLMIHGRPFTKEKSMQSSLDTSISRFSSPVLAQSASALSKKYLKQLQQNSSVWGFWLQMHFSWCILTVTDTFEIDPCLCNYIIL